MKAILEYLDAETQSFAVWLERLYNAVGGLVLAGFVGSFIGFELLDADITAPAWTAAAKAVAGLCAARFFVLPIVVTLIKSEIK